MRDEETKRRERGACLSRREEGTASPSTACSRIHACTYQYRPCMTRRLTGHADKNEEKLLSHSNRATFRSKPDNQDKVAQYCSYLVYKLKKRTIQYKEILTNDNYISLRWPELISTLISGDNCSNNWTNNNDSLR